MVWTLFLSLFRYLKGHVVNETLDLIQIIMTLWNPCTILGSPATSFTINWKGTVDKISWVLRLKGHRKANITIICSARLNNIHVYAWQIMHLTFHSIKRYSITSIILLMQIMKPDTLTHRTTILRICVPLLISAFCKLEPNKNHCENHDNLKYTFLLCGWSSG